MPRKQPQKPDNQDPILQAFEETKGEQLDLLDGFVPLEGEENNQAQDSHPEDAHWSKGEEVGRVPVQQEELPEQEEEHQEEQAFEAPPIRWFKGYDGEEYTEDEWNAPVMRGGPSRKEVEGWKERFGGLVYFTPFEGDVFVWRTLQRPEYREIIRDQTLTALDREEYFTEKCVLYPYDFSIEKIKKSRAGIASLLSEMIMDKSGFVAQSAPIKL
jgi:hypothetical protein